MTGQQSTITSFKSNRFNNLFEAAAALHFHRQDILDCLRSLPRLNKKLESIMEDNQSHGIDCQVVALGLVYFQVTGPYWQLLGQGLHYLHFFAYVEELYSFFRKWSDDPNDAFSADFHPLFGFNFMLSLDIFNSLLNIGEENKVTVKDVLKNISRGCIEVMEHLLTDFLPGGRYHNLDDAVLRKKMAHSEMTNLVGEQCFGDLDFSLFKRRNATLHHHSTINILKRNKSISRYFCLKSKEDQTQLLKLSAKKASKLRKQHVIEEKEAVVQRTLVLQESRANKAAAADRKRAKLQDVMEKMRPHHGP